MAVPRRTELRVRISRAGGPARTFRAQSRGTLLVPTGDLVPDPPTPSEPAPGPTTEFTPLTPEQSRRVAASPSMSPVATDPGSPYQGGGGLFDLIASRVHPAVTAGGSPGRRLAFSMATGDHLTRTVRRMLTGPLPSQDLSSADGGTRASVRLTAEITSVRPLPLRRAVGGVTEDGRPKGKQPVRGDDVPQEPPPPGERSSVFATVLALLLQGAGNTSPDAWVMAGPGLYRARAAGESRSTAVSASLTRTAVSEPGGRMWLVQADLVVVMAAEVSAKHNPPRTVARGLELPGAVVAWVSEEQARRAGLGPALDAHLAAAETPTGSPVPPALPRPAVADSADGNPFLAGTWGRSDGVCPALPGPAPRPAPGAGEARAPDGPQRRGPAAARPGDAGPVRQHSAADAGARRARRCLPPSGAMDGGVPVPLYDRSGRVVFEARVVVTRSRGAYLGPSGSRQSMMYTTSASAVRSTGRTTVSRRAVPVFGLPLGYPGEHDGPRGAVAGSSRSRRRPPSSARRRTGTGPAASSSSPPPTRHASTCGSRSRCPWNCTVRADPPAPPGTRTEPAAVVELATRPTRGDERGLDFRMLRSDLLALSRLSPARQAPPPVVLLGDEAPSRDRWRSSGSPVPPEAQVNTFQGTELVRGRTRRPGPGAAGSVGVHHGRDGRGDDPAGGAVHGVADLRAARARRHGCRHAGGVRPETATGEDLRWTADARLRHGRVLGTGERMVFEFDADAHPDVWQEGASGAVLRSPRRPTCTPAAAGRASGPPTRTRGSSSRVPRCGSRRRWARAGRPAWRGSRSPRGTAPRASPARLRHHGHPGAHGPDHGRGTPGEPRPVARPPRALRARRTAHGPPGTRLADGDRRPARDARPHTARPGWPARARRVCRWGRPPTTTP
ncbi:hypothetical protein SFUMM280S_11284 [Streptomyces fumanus]